ncbi:MAG TPA: septal ring lytic transglycosylase RlpA family protein, partial [Methylomirabilota bacterium]|nr:septal ring lytic transglycosylase RlpA family protein [Methylomirabilota bacterium]
MVGKALLSRNRGLRMSAYRAGNSHSRVPARFCLIRGRCIRSRVGAPDDIVQRSGTSRMNERRPVSRTLVPTKPTRRIVCALTTSVVVALAVAGCSATSKSTGKTAATTAEIDPKLGVAPSPRIVAFGEPVPKGGGRTMVGKPYKVAGKRYVPRLEPNYSKVGLASWYGNAFHGRKTANGEVFDSEHLSAAHPTMPLPSYARVTSVTTGRSVVVRVNDRGPFHSSRLIDISRRTAEVIGVRSAGIAKVKVEYIGPAPTHGDDHEYLMASYRGPADLPERLPETMIASAESLPGVAARATFSAASAAAGLFGGGKSAPTATATADPAPVGPRIPGSVLPPVRPLLDGEVYVMVASVDPA